MIEKIIENSVSMIGKYYIDFLVSYNILGQSQKVLIECDSQQWHETTEDQRRYEKSRDRYLLKKGYKVFHYTGKEIINNPYIVACEVLEHLTGEKELIGYFLNYNNCESYNV